MTDKRKVYNISEIGRTATFSELRKLVEYVRFCISFQKFAPQWVIPQRQMPQDTVQSIWTQTSKQGKN